MHYRLTLFALLALAGCGMDT